MTDVSETVSSYATTCRELGKQPHPYIVKVLEQLKQSSKGQTQSSAQLHLAGNNKLMTDVRLTDEDAEVLYKWLKNNLCVTSLDLRYNQFTDIGITDLAKLIEESMSLKEVNIMCNDFSEDGAAHLAKALQKNEVLTTLQLNGNKIGNRGGMYFAQALQVNATLEALDLGDTDLKTESVIALATVLNYNSSLKSLNVNRPILFTHQEEPTVHFSKMLKVNRSLKEIHLQKYDMRDFGATRLAENLMDNFSLTYLNLSCNRITRDGAKELANLLRNNSGLQVLDLGFNRLGDDGALHLAEALATYNTTLTTLVVVSNEMKGRGLCALANCLKMNTVLTNIYIWGNELEESACIAYSSLLESGRLESADTDVEPYIVDGITHLSQLSHGIRQWYLWGPSHGGQAQPSMQH